MEFRISITQDAETQFLGFSIREQRLIEAAIDARLKFTPTQPTHAVKRLRPNPLAEFELRVGDIRILYNVNSDDSEVVLLVFGRKVGNKLIVQGEEFHGHHNDPPQRTPDGSTGPTE